MYKGSDSRTSFYHIEYLRRMLELVLKCNNFKFNIKHFLEKYIYINSKPRIWFRFIDDIWGLHTGDKSSFDSVVERINSTHLSIKFSGGFSTKEVDFLDVTTYRKGDKMFSRLFCKPTDSHSYLEFNSCHPPQNKNSIPYSQFLRIRRNCTEWEDFLQNGLKLSVYFSIRGYPIELEV